MKQLNYEDYVIGSISGSIMNDYDYMPILILRVVASS